MTSPKDRRYFRRRAEAELKAASATESTAACQAHYEMAERYLERVYPPAANDPGAGDAAGDMAAEGNSAA